MYIRQQHEHDYSLTAPLACGPLPIIATAVSLAATAASTVIGVVGANQQASAARHEALAQQQANEYKAKVYERKAQEARATSQRAALDTTRRGELAQSQLRARAAASGAGATDESVLALGEQIAGRGQYEHDMQMYSGEAQATGFYDAAKAERYNGDVAVMAGENRARAARLSGVGTLVSGIGNFASKAASFDFGGGGGGTKLPTGGSTFDDLPDGGFHRLSYG